MKNAIASRKAIRAIRKSTVSVAWSLRTTITAEIAATISMPRRNGLIGLTPVKVAAFHDDQRSAVRRLTFPDGSSRSHRSCIPPKVRQEVDAQRAFAACPTNALRRSGGRHGGRPPLHVHVGLKLYP